MTTINSTSRAMAALSGAKTYDTGQPCKRGHLSPRQTSNGGCIACMRPTVVKPTMVQLPFNFPFFVALDMTAEDINALEVYLSQCTEYYCVEILKKPLPISAAKLQFIQMFKKPLREVPAGY